MSSLTSACLLFFCFVLVRSSGVPVSGSGNHAALFIFGDSLFDVGNNNFIDVPAESQANFWPYGQTFFNRPTGRFTDGRVIHDFIAEKMKLPVFPPPYLQPIRELRYGVNFASGGGGILVETFQGRVIDLRTQVEYYKEAIRELSNQLGAEETKKLFSRSIYLFCIGSNDYAAPLKTASTLFNTHTRKEFSDMVIRNLSVLVEEVYRNGGRRFGFMNMGAWGCAPMLKVFANSSKDGCHADANELMELHNKRLRNMLDNLTHNLPGFRYSIFDFFTSLGLRIENPSKYGFKEANIACCGGGPYRGYYSCGGKRDVKEWELCQNPDDYLFYDAAHPTEKANKQFAELWWSGNPDVSGPHNLKALLEQDSDTEESCRNTDINEIISYPFNDIACAVK